LALHDQVDDRRHFVQAQVLATSEACDEFRDQHALGLSRQATGLAAILSRVPPNGKRTLLARAGCV
jgi:hypothetical protein